jgi:hypothetical protein
MSSKMNGVIWRILLALIVASTFISGCFWVVSRNIDASFDLTGDAPTQDVLELTKGERYDVQPHDPKNPNTLALEDFWHSYLVNLIKFTNDETSAVLKQHRSELSSQDNLMLIVSWGFPDDFQVGLITNQDISTQPISLTNEQVKYLYKDIKKSLPPQSNRQTFEIMRMDLAMTFSYNKLLAIFQDIIFSRQWYANPSSQHSIQPYWKVQEHEKPNIRLLLQDKAPQPYTPLIEVLMPFPQRDQKGSDLIRVLSGLEDYQAFLPRYLKTLPEQKAVRLALCNLGEIQRFVLEITTGEHKGRLWAENDSRRCLVIIPAPPGGGPYPPLFF